MLWWNEVLAKLNASDILFTPGRGLSGIGKKPFKVLSKDLHTIFISSGKSKIPLEKVCFDTIEKALSENPYLWLRCASLHDSEPFENSADELIRSKVTFVQSVLDDLTGLFTLMANGLIMV